jgi:outer membrane protein TolC
VERAFAEVQDASRRLDAYTRALRYARQWLLKVQQGIDVGTYEDEEIVDPAKEYALKRFSQMTATFDYNVAVARLALATGWDAITVE